MAMAILAILPCGRRAAGKSNLDGYWPPMEKAQKFTKFARAAAQGQERLVLKAGNRASRTFCELLRQTGKKKFSFLGQQS
jgi:hypothetical protein